VADRLGSMQKVKDAEPLLSGYPDVDVDENYNVDKANI
jgi:hypothetical protein